MTNCDDLADAIRPFVQWWVANNPGALVSPANPTEEQWAKVARALERHDNPDSYGDPDEDAEGPSHHSAPETSRLAALNNEPRSGTQRRVVLECIVACGVSGATDEEIQSMTGMAGNTERPRRVELVAGEWVCDSGMRRSTCKGDLAVVWVASGKARSWASVAP